MHRASPDLPAELAAHARRRRVAAGALVFRDASPARAVWFLVTGAVGLVRFGRGGEEVVIHRARAGEWFAEASLHGERYHCSAVATRASEVLEVPATAIRARLAADPAFALEWIATLSRQLMHARGRLERAGLRGAHDRVRHLLLTEGEGPDGGYRPEGTLKDLAAYLGLSHEALYRTLASMRRTGTLRRDGDRLSLAPPGASDDAPGRPRAREGPDTGGPTTGSR